MDLKEHIHNKSWIFHLIDSATKLSAALLINNKETETICQAMFSGWRSKRIPRVTKSPLASEASALGDAADAGYLIASMTKEVFNLKTAPPIHCKTDSTTNQLQNRQQILSPDTTHLNISK